VKASNAAFARTCRVRVIVQTNMVTQGSLERMEQEQI
jgi:hypothetical protein